MPKSVKVRIKCLRHKGIITTEEMNKLIKALEEEQIEVVPHAKWEQGCDGAYNGTFKCSNCERLLSKANYCSNCGAKMDKE